MKIFVTGVNGQLGHDVMNELALRGHVGIGSDLAPAYSGMADGTAVTTAPYVSLDITDANAVRRVITDVQPDAVIHCAAWTAVDMAEDDDKVALSQYGLCVQRAGDGAVAAGLQGLPAPQRLWPDQA